MKRHILGGCLAASFLLAPAAQASHCDEGCIVIADAIIGIGGVVSSIGMQVALLEGQPSEEWAMAGAVFGVGNAIGGGIVLLVSLAVSDDDLATALRIIGGTQLAIAAGDGLGVAMTHLALGDSVIVPRSSEPTPQAMGLRVSF